MTRDASAPSGRPPRVLYVITRAIRGGAQSHVAEILRGLAGEEDASLVTGGEGELCRAARGLGVSVQVVPRLVVPVRPVSDVMALAGLVGVIRRTRPDLVSCHSSKAGVIGRLAARLCGVPSIFTAHGWAFAEGAPWTRRVGAAWVEKLASRVGGTVVVVSEADRQLALDRRVVPEARMVTVRNGVADVAERASPGSAGPARIVMVARFEPPKDFGVLLRALAGVAAPWELTLVGGGPGREAVEASVRSMGLGPRVRFLGDRGDVPRILAGAHVFVLTSRSEGLPLTVLEAMRAGLPVVATNVGGVCEAVVDGESGFLVPAGDVPVLAGCLERLAADAGLRSRVGASGRERFERFFRAERMLTEIRDVYARVLPGPLTRRPQ